MLHKIVRSATAITVKQDMMMEGQDTVVIALRWRLSMVVMNHAKRSLAVMTNNYDSVLQFLFLYFIYWCGKRAGYNKALDELEEEDL